jgi:hypothetical protein
MHLGDRVHRDNSSPQAQHHLNDQDLVKSRIDVRQRSGHRRLRCRHSRQDCGQQNNLGGNPGDLRPRDRGAHFDARRNPANQSSRPFQNRGADIQAEHSDRRLNRYVHRNPQRPQNRKIGVVGKRLRPLARKRRNSWTHRRERNYVARRIGVDDTPNRRARLSPYSEERCDRSASPVRHRSPRSAAAYATLASRHIAP